MMPPSPTQPIGLALSREELYVIMRLLNASELPGFDLSWLTIAPVGTVTNDTRRVLEAATNALIARGYLAPGGLEITPPVKVVLPAPVISLVGTCAFGRRWIILSASKSAGPVEVHIHQLKALTVARTEPLPGIHRFEVISGQDALLRLVNDALSLQAQTAPVPGIPNGRVRAEAVARAPLVENGKAEEAAALLIHGGLPAHTARALAQAMKDAVSIGGICIVSRSANQQTQSTVLRVVTTARHCFTIGGGRSQDDLLVQATSAEAVRQWLTFSLSRGCSEL